MGVFKASVVNGILAAMGFRADADDPLFRLDAGETAGFLRQLEHIETEIYKVDYPANRAVEFIPVDTTVPPWAESFTWRQYDWAGMAKIITRFADDLPAVDIMAAEKTQRCQSIGNSFSWSLQDLRAAAKLGISLETEKGELARESHENKVEDLSTFGDAAADLPGFLNNGNVPILSAPGDLNGDWLNPGTTAKEVLTDMHTIANSVTLVTKNTQKPDTMLLPFAHYAHVSTTQLNDFQETTILDAFLKQSPYVRNVDQWLPLSTADAARTGPRVVCYRRDPKVVRLVRPSPFNMLPPQARNLAFNVPCESRVGGVSWRRPLGAVYADLGG